MCGCRKCLVNLVQVFLCQRNVKTSGIFLDMGGVACLRDRDDILRPHHPCQHDLRGSGTMSAGYLCQRPVAPQPSFSKRSVGHDRNFMLLAPRDKVIFDATVFQVVEHLVGRTFPAMRQGKDMLHVRHIEVAHAPLQDFPFLLQLCQGADYLGKRVTSNPVQQIKVDVIRTEDTDPLYSRQISGDLLSGE